MRQPILFIFLFFISCNLPTEKNQSSENETINNNIEPVSNSKSEAETATSTYLEKNLKEEVILGNFIVKVNKIQDFKASEPMSPAKAGNKFVAIEVEYFNRSDKPVECNQGDWKLYDQEDYSYDISPNYKQPELPFTTINPSQHVKGWITFEVQNSAKEFKAQFKPGVYTSDNAMINLK